MSFISSLPCKTRLFLKANSQLEQSTLFPVYCRKQTTGIPTQVCFPDVVRKKENSYRGLMSPAGVMAETKEFEVKPAVCQKISGRVILFSCFLRGVDCHLQFFDCLAEFHNAEEDRVDDKYLY